MRGEQNSESKKIANCDKHGAVYLGDREVFRAIPKDHVESVTEVVNKLNNKIDGIVKLPYLMIKRLMRS